MQNTNYENQKSTGSRIFRWGIIGLVLTLILVGLVSLGALFENNGAGEILVIQAPFSGKLTAYTDPGRKWQGWGTVTHYRKSNQFDFQSKGNDDRSIKIRFNDGGHAQVSGAARFDLPLDPAAILDIHQTFGSQGALEHDLIKSVMDKSIYLTGPLLSSKESYSEKRSDMLNLFEDQAVHGVLQTIPVSKEVDDLITGQKKWITTVEPRRVDGVIQRQEASPLIRFKIKLYNISINDIDYEDIVDKQIATQQQATMDVQIAITNSKKAEQDVMTAKAQGEAAAAKAKWEQEVEKATEVTRAEKEKAVAETKANKDKIVAETAAKQRLAVSEFDKQAAEQTKQANILLGEGESQRRKLNIQANGALEQKLATLDNINRYYADAIARHQGPLVPSVIFGATQGGQTSSVNDFMDLLKAKTARDLSIDMGVSGTQPRQGGIQP